MLIAKINSFCNLGMPIPIMMDWVVIAAYTTASVLCFKGANLAAGLAYKKHAKLWLFLAVSIFILGLNKFLYAENCITQGFSIIARNYGWYGSRRGLQLEIILVLVFLCICVLGVLIAILKGIGKPTQFAVIAFVLLLLLVIVRTISLHQIDGLIFPDILGIGIGINWLIELGCNVCMACAACFYLNNQQTSNF